MGSESCVRLMNFPKTTTVLKPNKYLMGGEARGAFLALKCLLQLLWRRRGWSQLCDSPSERGAGVKGHLTSVSVKSPAGFDGY